MDEDRRKWLEEALKSMTVDVIELLQKQIKILQDMDNVEAEDDVTKYEEAIAIILDHVDHLDIACDFHKIGGFMVLYPCLKSKNAKIRAGGCELLAVLCQNNPYCQQVVLDNEFIPKLLNMLEKDEDPLVGLKALYALSAIVRHCQEGFNQFIHYNGPAILLKTLGRAESHKFITKATFLLKSLCDSQPDFKSRLVFLEYVPALISLVIGDRRPSDEHVLSLLTSLLEDSATAVNECKNLRYNLNDALQKRVASIKDQPEHMEEEQACRRILQLVFGWR
ncbi:hsp70-binding protein 1-like isoform X2 [Cylas formicarius]|nr:hsp70-binding protein 1-like isoform X2 [Cylas formicarius]